MLHGVVVMVRLQIVLLLAAIGLFPLVVTLVLPCLSVRSRVSATSSSASASRTPHNDSSNKWSAEPYDHGVSTLWCVKRSTAYGIQYSGTFERWAWHGMAWFGSIEFVIFGPSVCPLNNVVGT